MHSLVLITAALSLLAASDVARADARADNIVKIADDARGIQDSYSMIAKVRDSRDGEIKDSVYQVYSNGGMYTLVDQREPVRQQGRKLLMRDHDLWLYTPNISRPTRISFEQKLTGEVSNGDLMRTNFAEDYAATIIGEEREGGEVCYKLDLKARNKDATYRRIVYWVDKTRNFPLKAQFYALSGKLLKTAVYSGFKVILGKPRMTQALITDSLQANKTSIIVYSKQKLVKLNDSFFNKESLGN